MCLGIVKHTQSNHLIRIKWEQKATNLFKYINVSWKKKSCINLTQQNGDCFWMNIYKSDEIIKYANSNFVCLDVRKYFEKLWNLLPILCSDLVALSFLRSNINISYNKFNTNFIFGTKKMLYPRIYLCILNNLNDWISQLQNNKKKKKGNKQHKTGHFFALELAELFLLWHTLSAIIKLLFE